MNMNEKYNHNHRLIFESEIKIKELEIIKLKAQMENFEIEHKIMQKRSKE